MKSHAHIPALVLGCLALACGDTSLRTIAGTQADDVGRATVSALISADTVALDTLVASSTRRAPSFSALVLTASQLRTAVEDSVRLVGAERQRESSGVDISHVRYVVATVDKRFRIDIWVERRGERWWAETVQISPLRDD